VLNSKAEIGVAVLDLLVAPTDRFIVFPCLNNIRVLISEQNKKFIHFISYFSIEKNWYMFPERKRFWTWQE
jgi:hypothetical protein